MNNYLEKPSPTFISSSARPEPGASLMEIRFVCRRSVKYRPMPKAYSAICRTPSRFRAVERRTRDIELNEQTHGQSDTHRVNIDRGH